MHFPIPQPDGSSVIELDARETTCVVEGCAGTIVRHSLGSGQAVYRCVRCFRRYQSKAATAAAATAVMENAENRGRWRRMLDEFVTWRDDD